MATATPLMIVPAPQKHQEPDTWDGFIARIGTALSTIEQRLDAASDAASWEKARILIDADQEGMRRPEMQGKSLHEVRYKITQDLRVWWEKNPRVRPPRRLLGDIRKMFDMKPEIFDNREEMSVPRTDILPFQHNRQIAVCSLPTEQKQDLWQWAKETQPPREKLRQTIREKVDALKGIYKPDFDLKVSNHWMFNGQKRSDGFEGGVNMELYANLIHFFSDPGDTILDPFAGGGMLAQTLQAYRHFQGVTLADYSGARQALMSDITPLREDIVQADARLGLPFPDACAHLAILDPPYLLMAEGKYHDFGEIVEEWEANLAAVLPHVERCLVPGGRVVIMTDDVVRMQYHVPTGMRVALLMETRGWEAVTTIYNFNRNFIAMSPAQMARMKERRLLVNGVKLIQVARIPETRR